MSLSKNKSKLRLLAVAATSLIFLSTLGALGYTVSRAITSMAATADEIDDTRAVTAANGALKALQKQLGATVRDNAYWDDAYRQILTSNAAAWATENWGSTTADYPLYDTALVITADGHPLMALHKGETIADPSAFFLGKLDEVLTVARRPDPTRDGLPVAFIRTMDGIAIIGAAAIQPSAFEADVDQTKLNVLVFSKQLTSKVLAEISQTFTIDGLALSDSADPKQVLYADVKDVAGNRIAYLTWPHVDPGTAGYLKVKPTVVGAGVALIVLLAAVGAVGFIVFRAIRTGERLSNYKAKHDALTGLWNRAGFLEQITAAIEMNPGGISLDLLDLDGFKPVNDAWGHAVGDELIRTVAERLVSQLPSGSIVARLGGDEFAVISEKKEIDGRSIGSEILDAFSVPFMIGGRTIEIGGSVGTADTSEAMVDGTELLRRADLALYRAKDSGRGILVRYDASLDDEAGKVAMLEQQLRQALLRDGIRTVFQPLIDASTREIRGIEALARWTTSTGEQISPEVFIRVAEKAGLIDVLGFNVLKTAVQAGSKWPGISVAVNVSPLQLRNPYFASQVSDVLKEASFDPKRLTIEVTEGVLIANPDQAKRAFAALRAIGVKIALDDFGCGFASIGALREFGFDRMKIDRSLILALDHDDRNGAVLQATIALANALRLPVTAEGIETEEQATVVRLSGCDQLQGYLFSRPVSANEITKLYFSTSPSRLVG
ncbi:bifunctional diguanylate cyclase/phosphodiesterase [Rhizobium leguminosarum bv. trifolii]|uniref:putative bifunctional diguanylate cyclase/phosphodiesterase n=1 Tax=Rhizobium leguminosarum TaxID=384 RepID=UPI000E2EB642|nr:EAL domain-containing protein [Rhizobium leguminosarum]RFB88853.1 bifunctional diguanylate cyclase/phosphodiesterase [Rhizobium leguminosarum bv. trifolii]